MSFTGVVVKKYRLESEIYGRFDTSKKAINFKAEDDLKALQKAYIVVYYSNFKKPTDEDKEMFAGVEEGEYDKDEDKTLLSFEALADLFTENSEEVSSVLKNEAGQTIFSTDEGLENEEDWEDEDE